MIDFDSLKDLIRRAWRSVMTQLVWSAKSRQEFYDMTAGFIEDGMPVFDAIREFEARWKEKKDLRAPYMTEMLLAMRGGRTGKALRLGEAITAFAPSIEAMAIDGGEQVGQGAEGLRMASRLAGVQMRIKGTLYGEMVYPGFLLCLFMAALFAVNILMLPVFKELAPEHTWSDSARYMALIAGNAEYISAGLVATILLVFTAFMATRGPWVGGGREVFDQWIAPWTVYRRISGAVMMACFANFLRAGIPLSAVLDRLAMVSTPWELNHLLAIRNRMRRGAHDGEAIAGPLFDEDIRWQISVYGQMTSFNEALLSLSERTINAVIERVKSLASVLRFVVMAMVAGMIVWVYAAFFGIAMSARTGAGV